MKKPNSFELGFFRRDQEKIAAWRRGNPRRGFPLFSAELKIHTFLRFRSTGSFADCGQGRGALPLGPHFIFSSRRKRSKKSLNCPAGLEFHKVSAIPLFEFFHDRIVQMQVPRPAAEAVHLPGISLGSRCRR